VTKRIEYDPSVIHTVASLSAYWRCDQNTVRHLIRTGRLQAFRVGKELRVTDKALREYEEGVYVR